MTSTGEITKYSPIKSIVDFEFDRTNEVKIDMRTMKKIENKIV